MGETAYRFFLIESGPLLEKVKALREEHDAVHKVLAAYAEKYGASGFFLSGGGFAAGRQRPRLYGLTIARPMPAGWKLDRSRRYMEPYAKEKELQAEMKALPTFPNLRGDISKAIGWEPSYRSESHPDRTYSRPTCQLIWSGDKHCICAPLHTDFGGMTEDTVKAAMAHPVPDGCREITHVQWELISVTEKVGQEQAA